MWKATYVHYDYNGTSLIYFNSNIELLNESNH